jgi:hypothetical protein
MAERTPFLGLLRIPPGEPLSLEGSEFQYIDPLVVDHIAKIGAILHKHDGAAALADPVTAPTLATSAAGGSIAGNTTVLTTYTWIDAEGGETLPAPTANVTTAATFPEPKDVPTAVVSTAAGALLAANYVYGVTVTDGEGGETTISPLVEAVVEPGFAKAEVTVSKLKAILTEVAGATVGAEWRLWRRQNGGEWNLIDTGVGETIVDDGTLVPDCTVQPPSVSTTHSTNKITVVVPDPVGTPEFFRLYLTIDGTFGPVSYVAEYPIAECEKPIDLTTLAVLPGTPPPISRAYPHANKIDPDTDMVEWPWKRPVANAAALPKEGNEEGDVRETLNDHVLHAWDGETKVWAAIGGSGTPLIIEDPTGAGMAEEPKLQFAGSSVTVTDEPEKSRTVVTIADGTLISYKGAWSAETTYKVDDIVTRTGGSYLALAETKGVDPATDEGVHWGILATPGAEGAEGKGGEGLKWKGAWSNVTTYAVNDAVSYGGASYVSIKAGNTANNPDETIGIDWAVIAAAGIGLTPRGEWSKVTTYNAEDLVQRNGSAYISKAGGNLNNDPALDLSHTYWNLLVERGGEGPPGESSTLYWEGEYKAASTYHQKSIVWLAGNTYISNSAENKGNNPTTDKGVHWELFAGSRVDLVWRGEYEEATNYTKNDVVWDLGKTYISIVKENKGHKPGTDEGVHWELHSFLGTIESHTWSLPGEVKEEEVPGFFSFLAAGEMVQRLRGLSAVINVGTQVKVTIKLNGVAIPELTNVDVGKAKIEVETKDVYLTTGDLITLELTGLSEAPASLTASLFIEHLEG